MANPERFDVDPDPTFHADADPYPDLKKLTKGEKKFFKIFNYCFEILTKLVMCNFLSKNSGGGVRDKG